MKIGKILFYFWAIVLLFVYYIFYSSDKLNLLSKIFVVFLLSIVVIYFGYLLKLFMNYVTLKEKIIKISVISIFLYFFCFILILLLLSSILDGFSFYSICLAMGQVFFTLP